MPALARRLAGCTANSPPSPLRSCPRHAAGLPAQQPGGGARRRAPRIPALPQRPLLWPPAAAGCAGGRRGAGARVSAPPHRASGVRQEGGLRRACWHCMLQPIRMPCGPAVVPCHPTQPLYSSPLCELLPFLATRHLVHARSVPCCPPLSHALSLLCPSFSCSYNPFCFIAAPFCSSFQHHTQLPLDTNSPSATRSRPADPIPLHAAAAPQLLYDMHAAPLMPLCSTI